MPGTVSTTITPNTQSESSASPSQLNFKTHTYTLTHSNAGRSIDTHMHASARALQHACIHMTHIRTRAAVLFTSAFCVRHFGHKRARRCGCCSARAGRPFSPSGSSLPQLPDARLGWVCEACTTASAPFLRASFHVSSHRR